MHTFRVLSRTFQEEIYPVRNNAPLLSPGQAPPRLPARRVLQLGEKGSCPGGRLSEPEAAAGLPILK